MEIVGHRAIIDYFEHLHHTGTFHHAYCFTGPASVGKTTLARVLSAQILSTSFEKLALHPDFLLIEQETNEETGKLRKDITIAQIERIVQKVACLPIMSDYNIVIIDKAEKMNLHGSNALLKTLEEPSTKTIFFLVVENEEELLATIRSRVHMIHFYKLEESEMRQSLEGFGLPEERVQEFVQYADGRPGQALQWAQNPESFEEYKQEIQRFFSLFHQPLFEKIKRVEDLFKDKENHIAGREKLKEVLQIWQRCLHDLLQGKNTQPQVEKKQLIEIYNSIEKTLLSMGQNVHPRLLVENILLSLP